MWFFHMDFCLKVHLHVWFLSPIVQFDAIWKLSICRKQFLPQCLQKTMTFLKLLFFRPIKNFEIALYCTIGLKNLPSKLTLRFFQNNPQSSCPPAFSSIGKPTIETSKGGKRCRNTQHKDTQHNDTQHDNKIMQHSA